LIHVRGFSLTPKGPIFSFWVGGNFLLSKSVSL
jgi:hypothetical protein